MKSNSDYSPIDCGFYDRLEDLATRGVEAELVLDQSKKQPREVTGLAAENSSVEFGDKDASTIVRGTIADVFAKSGADWAVIRTEEGEHTVRLDEIVSVDGIARPMGDETCAIPARNHPTK